LEGSGVSTEPLIEVLYTCKNCRTVDVPVMVRARRDVEDVRDWVAMAGHAIYSHHRQLKPRCRVLLDLKIPIQDELPIGAVRPQ
jgi:hypothetical protein